MGAGKIEARLVPLVLGQAFRRSDMYRNQE